MFKKRFEFVRNMYPTMKNSFQGQIQARYMFFVLSEFKTKNMYPGTNFVSRKQ